MPLTESFRTTTFRTIGGTESGTAPDGSPMLDVTLDVIATTARGR